MITIKIEFDYDGRHIKFAAYLKDDMTLSVSKKNAGVDLVEDIEEGRWSLVFNEMFEVVMYRDADGNRTCEAERAIIWNVQKGYILDEVEARSKVSYK